MAQPTYDQLLDIIAEKDGQIGHLEAHVAQLEARMAQLEQVLEKATRSNKRQAAIGEQLFTTVDCEKCPVRAHQGCE